MSPDINLKGYYLQFINDANRDIAKYKEGLDTTEKIKEELYNYIDNNRTIIADTFNIDVTSYDLEWNKKVYNDFETLYNKTLKVVNSIEEHEYKVHILQLLKYCNTLRIEYKYNRLIKLANKRKDMKFGVYRKYVSDYYNKVHKCVLNGMGYRFGYGIGTFVINYWKMDEAKAKKSRRIDFAATNAKKKEIIAKGLKPYDDKLAAWYKARKIPYDGVDYRIYKVENFFYDITFIKSTILSNGTLDYQRTEYVGAKYRGMSYKEMADKLCKTDDDIYNLKVDIKYKLNIVIYKDPTKYLNYIRNAEQCKYKRGAHNS